MVTRKRDESTSHGSYGMLLPEDTNRISPELIERWLAQDGPALRLSWLARLGLWPAALFHRVRLSPLRALTTFLGAAGVAGIAWLVLQQSPDWRAFWLTLLALALCFPAFLAALLLLDGVNVVRGWRDWWSARGQDEVALPLVQADGEGLLVGDLVPKRIPWWQLEEIVEEGGLWLAHYPGGSFWFDPTERGQKWLGRAMRLLIDAHSQGYLLPGELPAADESIPPGAISLARMTGANEALERGISLVDEDAEES